MSKGRGNSTAITTKEAIRLNINELIRNNLFSDGKTIEAKISWGNGANISVITQCQTHVKKICLKYLFNGSLKEYDVLIAETPSNLGKGSLMYFICPETGVKCKTLYCCYNSSVFKSRNAYKERIYYFIQTISKAYRTGSRYRMTDNKVNELHGQIRTKYYKGNQTKKYRYLLRLINKRAELNDKNNEEFNRYLHKYLGIPYWG